MPLPIGNIVVADTETGPDHVFEHLLMHEIEKYGFVKEEAKEMLRIVAAMLQTINQPRYVRRAQRDVSQIKRQRIKNSLGRYIPDAWNMISWNVDNQLFLKQVTKEPDQGRVYTTEEDIGAKLSHTGRAHVGAKRACVGKRISTATKPDTQNMGF